MLFKEYPCLHWESYETQEQKVRRYLLLKPLVNIVNILP
jgi:hypothetical protein